MCGLPRPWITRLLSTVVTLKPACVLCTQYTSAWKLHMNTTWTLGLINWAISREISGGTSSSLWRETLGDYNPSPASDAVCCPMGLFSCAMTIHLMGDTQRSSSCSRSIPHLALQLPWHWGNRWMFYREGSMCLFPPVWDNPVWFIFHTHTVTRLKKHRESVVVT